MNSAKKKILYLSIGGRSVLFKKNGPSEFFFGGREFLQKGHYFEIMEIDSNIYTVNNYMKELYNILEFYKKIVEEKIKNSKINNNLNTKSVPYQNELVYPSNEFKNNKFDLF